MEEIDKRVVEENQTRKILLLIEKAKDLDDAIEKVEALLAQSD